ncbi:hypothetical protein V8E53_007856 [Lactarius tabidus]
MRFTAYNMVYVHRRMPRIYCCLFTAFALLPAIGRTSAIFSYSPDVICHSSNATRYTSNVICCQPFILRVPILAPSILLLIGCRWPQPTDSNVISHLTPAIPLVCPAFSSCFLRAISLSTIHYWLP